MLQLLFDDFFPFWKELRLFEVVHGPQKSRNVPNRSNNDMVS